MHTEHSFADLTESLKKGLLDDQIVLVLARLEKSGSLTDGDRETLKKAVNILDLAKQGHAWLSNRTFTRQTSLGASYFGQAVEVMQDARSSAKFMENLELLKSTAQELAAGSTIPDKQRLHELRNFFFNASQIESDRTDQLLFGDADSKSLAWLAKGE